MKRMIISVILMSMVLFGILASCSDAVGGSGGNGRPEPPDKPGKQDSQEQSSEPTIGEATDLKDSNGNTIYSGSAAVSFSGKTKTISAAYLIDGVTVNITEGEFESASGSSDQVVFLVINGGKLNITGTSSSPVIITKSGSAASGGQVGDDYSFYGINSAIVVAGSSSSATISYAQINTSSNGSNAVVSAVNANVSISDSTITTTGNAGSRGLHATYGGKITADNVTISTSGKSCAALATDRGGGTVTASNMTLSTASAGSPLIYSTGTITVTDSTGNASGAQMVVVEGGSSAIITGCDFTCSGNGNRNGTSSSNGASHTVDAAGIFIYQSMSGDSSLGTDYFTATDSTFTVTGSGVPMFFLTNITANITLSGTNVFNFDGGYLILAEATSAWGNGSSGADVTLTSESVLSGNTVYRDTNSTLNINGSAVSSGEQVI